MPHVLMAVCCHDEFCTCPSDDTICSVNISMDIRLSTCKFTHASETFNWNLTENMHFINLHSWRVFGVVFSSTVRGVFNDVLGIFYDVSSGLAVCCWLNLLISARKNVKSKLAKFYRRPKKWVKKFVLHLQVSKQTFNGVTIKWWIGRNGVYISTYYNDYLTIRG